MYKMKQQLQVMSAVNHQCITRADKAIVCVGYPVLH